MVQQISAVDSALTPTHVSGCVLTLGLSHLVVDPGGGPWTAFSYCSPERGPPRLVPLNRSREQDNPPEPRHSDSAAWRRGPKDWANPPPFWKVFLLRSYVANPLNWHANSYKKHHQLSSCGFVSLKRTHASHLQRHDSTRSCKIQFFPDFREASPHRFLLFFFSEPGVPPGAANANVNASLLLGWFTHTNTALHFTGPHRFSFTFVCLFHYIDPHEI